MKTVPKIKVKDEKKKKIIPVQSDLSESSPFPEEPSTPVESPQPLSHSSKFRLSQRNSLKQQKKEDRNKSLGQKLNSSFSKFHKILISISSFFFFFRLQRKTGKQVYSTEFC